MPGQTAKPTLSGRFGAKAAAAATAKAAKAPVRYGPESLPPNIKNGVGRVTAVRLVQLGQDAKQKQLDGSSAAGQLQMVIDAAAVEPAKEKGKKFKSLFFPLFEKGASYWASHVPFSSRVDLDFDACVVEACNMMKVLAGPQFDTSNFDAALAALDKLKPHFSFETVLKPAGGKNPATGQPYPEATQEFWGRGVAYSGKPGAAVQNDTGKAAAAPAQATAPAEEFNEMEDLGSLADLADSDPAAAAKKGTPEFEAAAKLNKLANDAGITDEELPNFPTWRSILDEMQRRGGGGTGEAAEGVESAETGDDAVQDDDAVAEEEEVVEEEEAKEWEKGDECMHVPAKGKKAVLCTVVGLNKSKTKANVKEKGGKGQKWENVAVDALVRPE